MHAEAPAFDLLFLNQNGCVSSEPAPVFYERDHDELTNRQQGQALAWSRAVVHARWRRTVAFFPVHNKQHPRGPCLIWEVS